MRSLSFSLLVLTLIFVTETASAATVQYTGRVIGYNGGFSDPGGYVVAGTFSPGFDPLTYSCFYGDDVCNQDGDAYDQAVADGNFVPIGSGGLTDHDGNFDITGETMVDAGTPIWLFAFHPFYYSDLQVLTSSTDPSWVIPAQPSGYTLMHAQDAEIFVLGFSHQEGVALSGVPFPEPSSLALTILCSTLVIGSGKRRREV